jgi:hypothetical protein
VSVLPELSVLHIGHIVVIGILERFCNASAVSLLVFSCADKAVDDCEDDTDHRGYDLELILASYCRLGRKRFSQ